MQGSPETAVLEQPQQIDPATEEFSRVKRAALAVVTLAGSLGVGLAVESHYAEATPVGVVTSHSCPSTNNGLALGIENDRPISIAGNITIITSQGQEIDDGTGRFRLDAGPNQRASFVYNGADAKKVEDGKFKVALDGEQNDPLYEGVNCVPDTQPSPSASPSSTPSSSPSPIENKPAVVTNPGPAAAAPAQQQAAPNVCATPSDIPGYNCMATRKGPVDQPLSDGTICRIKDWFAKGYAENQAEAIRLADTAFNNQNDPAKIATANKVCPPKGFKASTRGTSSVVPKKVVSSNQNLNVTGDDAPVPSSQTDTKVDKQEVGTIILSANQPPEAPLNKPSAKESDSQNNDALPITFAGAAGIILGGVMLYKTRRRRQA